MGTETYGFCATTGLMTGVGLALDYAPVARETAFVWRNALSSLGTDRQTILMPSMPSPDYLFDHGLEPGKKPQQGTSLYSGV